MLCAGTLGAGSLAQSRLKHLFQARRQHHTGANSGHVCCQCCAALDATAVGISVLLVLSQMAYTASSNAHDGRACPVPAADALLAQALQQSTVCLLAWHFGPSIPCTLDPRPGGCPPSAEPSGRFHGDPCCKCGAAAATVYSAEHVLQVWVTVSRLSAPPASWIAQPPISEYLDS